MAQIVGQNILIPETYQKRIDGEEASRRVIALAEANKFDNLDLWVVLERAKAFFAFLSGTDKAE